MDAMIEVRRRLVEGDLRALYAIWLCAAMDNQFEPNTVEPPVPAGLAECVDALGPFMEFFGLDPLMLVAAAEGSPDVPGQPSREEPYRAWIEKLSHAESKRLVRRFLTEDAKAVKAETLATVRNSASVPDWPTMMSGRTLEMLQDRTGQLRAEHDERQRKKVEAGKKRKAAKKERERQDRMKEMAKDPQNWLRKTAELAEARGVANYKAAAEILVDLREAVGGDEGEKITRRQASHLVKKHPTLTRLKSSLRKRGLWE